MTLLRIALPLLVLAAFAAACASAQEAEDSTSASTSVESSSTIADPSSSSTDVSEPEVESSPTSEFPDIVAAQATRSENGSWRFDVTVSSPYDTPERYADAWRVLGPDGTEYGIRVLTHDHASEQPFTRSQSGIEIPDDVTTVTIEGRDLANGWGGGTLALELP